VHSDQIVFFIGSQHTEQPGTWLNSSYQVQNLDARQANVWVGFFPLLSIIIRPFKAKQNEKG